MKNKLNIFYIALIVTLVVLPTAVMMSWHRVTKNPNLRPLGVTQESLRAYDKANGTGDAVRIVAEVEWVPSQNDGHSRATLETAITRAFKAKGVDVYVFFHNGVDRTRVTYVVGYSRIGPYPTNRASAGISAAVEAYRMYDLGT